MVYRVLSDGIDIFGADTDSALLSPSLELELNSAGSFEFTLPPDHPSYDDISLMKSEIEVYEDDELIFFGRPAEISTDWYKQKKVVCEGALAYLNDAAIRPHKFEGELISNVFRYIIAQYNAQVAQDKQFNIGSITITDRYVYTEFDYDICMSVLMSTCVDSTGGYIFIRKETNGMYIDWLADVPYASDQPVQFAVNMLDLTQDTKAEDICSVVLPVGGQVDGVNITIASVNSGSDILEDATAISKYGRILKIQSWNDIIDPQSLKDKATAWLAEQQEDDITIETNAAELHYLDGSVGPYRLGQLVSVVSGPHGIDKEFPILKLSMSLDSGVKKVTLGTPPRKELTELSGITNSGGGSSGGSGGGGGGGTTGVTDVLVNGASVVSDHIARIAVPTDTVTSAQLNTAVTTLQSNFQDGVDAVYNACVAKGSTPASQSLSDVVQGVMDIPQGGDNIEITTKYSYSERGNTSASTYTADEDMVALAINLSINGQASNVNQYCYIATDGTVDQTESLRRDVWQNPNRNFAATIDVLSLDTGDDVNFSNDGVNTYVLRFRGIIKLASSITLKTLVDYALIADNGNNSRTVPVDSSKKYLVLVFWFNGTGGASTNLEMLNLASGDSNSAAADPTSIYFKAHMVSNASSIGIDFATANNYITKGHIIYEIE